MDLFGRFRKLDSSLQRGLDNSFARVFGGEVVPAEIDELLKQEAETALMEDRAGTVLAPSSFEVYITARDYDHLLASRPTLDAELRDRLSRFIRNEGWTVAAPVSVDLIKDANMHTGQLRCRSSFPATEKRNAQRSVAPQDASDAKKDAETSTSNSAPEWPRSEPNSGRSPVARPYNADSPDGTPGTTGASTSTGTAGPINPSINNPAVNPLASSAPPAAAAGAGALAGLARPQRRANAWGEPAAAPEDQEPAPNHTAEPTPSSKAHSEPKPAPETEVVNGPSADAVNGLDGMHTTGSGSYQAAQQRTVTLHLRDGSDRTYVLKTGSNTIGRGNQVDVRLPDTGVSRRHGDITWDGFDAVLTDLHSTNGTTVNDIPIENWLLADGDVIAMGHSEIEVHFR